MNIFLFGNRGSASLILDRLIDTEHSVVGVCCRNSALPVRLAAKLRVARWLMAWGMYPNPCFQYRDPFEDLEAPDRIARKYGVPVLDSRRLKTPEFDDALRRLNPDISLMAGFHRLVPPNIIAVPRIGMINFHPALLPRHRGATPNRWVIRNGEEETGVTAHFVSSEFDRGDIIVQRRVEARQGETWGELEQRLSDHTAGLAMEIVSLAARDEIPRSPQDEAKATYEPSFRGEHQFIDWSGEAVDVMRTCNAIRPRSGGFTYLRDILLCLWETHPLDHVDPRFPPGTVIGLDSERCPLVACGSGTLRVESFLERGRIEQAQTIVDRHAITPGQRFADRADRAA